MLFQRINRSDPEKIFLVVYNSYSTAALSNGQAVNWDFITDCDGVGVTRPLARATNGGIALAGVAAEGIAVGAYGLIQVYGYHSAVRVRAATSNTDLVVKGAPLAVNPVGSVFCLEAVATASKGIVVQQCGFALADWSSWTTTTVAAFLKCL